MIINWILFSIKGILGLEINYDNVYEFLKMSHNVYHIPSSKRWINTKFDLIKDISIEKNRVKGYLFGYDDNLVISFKGTSLYWVNNDVNIGLSDFKTCGNGIISGYYDDCHFSSTYIDKYNDNLYFSCCYYKQSRLFDDCKLCNATTKTSCCKQCYIKSLSFEKNYFSDVKDIVERVKSEYNFDKYNIYFTGHSLGGMLASIASMIYDKITITFETPGDVHYLRLINAPLPDKIYHFGHNADPVFTGKCGIKCSVFGYNMNTKCHSGYTCSYDSKGKLGYKESLLYHKSNYVLRHIVPYWKDEFPACVKLSNCTECEGWDYT